MQLRSFSRRQILGAGGVAITTALAGCAGVLNQIADQLLEDVNVLNDTDQERAGNILLTSGGETLLEREFTLTGSSGNDNNANIGTYADIWTEKGSYKAKIELRESIEDQSEASDTVTVNDTDEEMLLVGLGLENAEEPIVFRVGTSFTDVVDS